MPTGENDRSAPARPAPDATHTNPKGRPKAEADDTLMPPDDGSAQHVAGAIGRQLKTTYGKLLQEPVPQKFLDLLDELEAKSGGGTKKSGKDEGGD